MSEQFDGLVIDSADNTATLLRDVVAGEVVKLSDGEIVSAVDPVAFGHKIALKAIEKGAPVVKYGEVIGTASRPIAKGCHVHVENVDSCRARGDQKEEQKAAESSVKSEGAGHLVLTRPVLDARDITFMGYPRSDGSAGTRNYVGVISCVVCANDVVSKLGEIDGVAGFTHQQGCSQTMPDVQSIANILVDLAKNPNLGAVLYVSLGCESVPSNDVLSRAAAATGKPVELIVIQKEGGLTKALERGRQLIEAMKAKIAVDPVPVPFTKLKLGLKCGSSDTTQGLSANVIAGRITDIFAAAGASVVMGETTEFMGAEHIAAAHCVSDEVGRTIGDKVVRMEARARAVGVDMRGGQPTRGNIVGGLTTIEEKSLGALAKAGSAVFQRVISYGKNVEQPGLVMMDAPGREPEMLTGLASAGCNLILFTTGRGAPQGFPFVPVIKVTGNERTWQHMQEHMDCCVASVMNGQESYEAAAKRLFDAVMAYASGRKTKAEICNYNNSMNIYVTGPTI